jgi:hypothetical protein
MTGPDMVIALKESPKGEHSAVLAIWDSAVGGWVNVTRIITPEQANAIRDYWAKRERREVPDLIVKVSIPELGIA